MICVVATQASWWDIKKARESIDWLNAGRSNYFSNKAERHELFEAVTNTGCKSWLPKKQKEKQDLFYLCTNTTIRSELNPCYDMLPPWLLFWTSLFYESDRHPGDPDGVWRRHTRNKRREESILYLHEQGRTAARQGNIVMGCCSEIRGPECVKCPLSWDPDFSLSFTENLQRKLQLQGGFPRKLLQRILLCKMD